MPPVASEFDPRKAVEIVLYIARRIRQPTKMAVCKLLFFADKTSLEKYGRYISNDNYVAVEYGPIPSHTLDLIDDGGPVAASAFSLSGKTIQPSRDADLDWLSASDIECLDEILSQDGRKPAWELSEKSHQDPAYATAWKSRGTARSAPMAPESIASHFDNAEVLVPFLANRHSE